MKITEKPDRWVVLQMGDDLYKVFATWSGGYLNGDSWKLNSGISRVKQDNHYYYFFGFSGSCYQCSKGAYGVNGSYGLGVLGRIIDTDGVSLLEDREDWGGLFD